MPGSEDKLALLWELIDGCKKRGVKTLRYDGVGLFDGAVAFELHPDQTAGQSLLDALTREAPKPTDPTKCFKCQAAPRERGTLCRRCFLGEAGVQS